MVLSLLAAGSTRGFVFDIHHEDLVQLLEVKLRNVHSYDWVLLEFLTLRFVHTEFPAFPQLQLRFSCPGSGFHGGFCSRVFAAVSCESWYLLVCLTKLGGNSLLCNLIS